MSKFMYVLLNKLFGKKFRLLISKLILLCIKNDNKIGLYFCLLFYPYNKELKYSKELEFFKNNGNINDYGLTEEESKDLRYYAIKNKSLKCYVLLVSLNKRKTYYSWMRDEFKIVSDIKYFKLLEFIMDVGLSYKKVNKIDFNCNEFLKSHNGLFVSNTFDMALLNVLILKSDWVGVDLLLNKINFENTVKTNKIWYVRSLYKFLNKQNNYKTIKKCFERKIFKAEELVEFSGTRIYDTCCKELRSFDLFNGLKNNLSDIKNCDKLMENKKLMKI